jgi:hypothetical protein
MHVRSQEIAEEFKIEIVHLNPDVTGIDMLDL